MIAVIHWKDDGSPSIFKSVESVRETQKGIELKCFGNDPVIHRYSLIKQFAVLQEPLDVKEGS